MKVNKENLQKHADSVPNWVYLGLLLAMLATILMWATGCLMWEQEYDYDVIVIQEDAGIDAIEERDAGCDRNCPSHCSDPFRIDPVDTTPEPQEVFEIEIVEDYGMIQLELEEEDAGCGG